MSMSNNNMSIETNNVSDIYATNNPNSFYIPIVNNQITKKDIEDCFKNKNIGIINRVDFIINRVKNRREAFVYFSEIFDTQEAKTLLTDILNNKSQSKFYYSSNNFWPMYVNNNPISSNSPERKSNAIYTLEETIVDMKNTIGRLEHITDQHGENIKYILNSNTSDFKHKLPKTLRGASWPTQHH